MQQAFLGAFAALRPAPSSASARLAAPDRSQRLDREGRRSGVEFASGADPVLGRALGRPRATRRRLALCRPRQISQLPPRQRDAFVATTLHGLRRSEVPRTMGLSERAVRGLVHRARSTLRAGLTVLFPYPARAVALPRSRCPRSPVVRVRRPCAALATVASAGAAVGLGAGVRSARSSRRSARSSLPGARRCVIVAPSRVPRAARGPVTSHRRVGGAASRAQLAVAHALGCRGRRWPVAPPAPRSPPRFALPACGFSAARRLAVARALCCVLCYFMSASRSRAVVVGRRGLTYRRAPASFAASARRVVTALRGFSPFPRSFGPSESSSPSGRRARTSVGRSRPAAPTTRGVGSGRPRSTVAGRTAFCAPARRRRPQR